MRITKYLHSCMLVEDHGKRLLIDPGIFAFIEGLVRVDDIPRVDAILLTHTHVDHVHPETVRRIKERDDAEIIGNAAVAELLGKIGIIVTPVAGCDVDLAGFRFCATPARHEETLNPDIPENTAYIINDRLLVPGDSLSEELAVHKGVEALALPVIAPWASEPRVVAFVSLLMPKHVIPVHDGYVKPFFQEMMYERYRKALIEKGIEFHPLGEPGQSITLK